MLKRPGRTKATKPVYEYDGEVVSLRHLKKLAERDTLKDHMPESELVTKFKLSRARLRELQASGDVHAVRLRSRWYYSHADIVRLMKDGRLR